MLEPQDVVALTERAHRQNDLMLLEALRRKELAARLLTAFHRLEADITNDLPALLRAASTLPDGTPVFMSRNFAVYNDRKEDVAPHLLGSIRWKDDAPSFEQYQIALLKADPKAFGKLQRNARTNRRAKPTGEEFLIARQRSLDVKAMRDIWQRFQSEIFDYFERRLTDSQNRPSFAEAELIESIFEDAELQKALNYTFDKDFNLPETFGHNFND